MLSGYWANWGYDHRVARRKASNQTRPPSDLAAALAELDADEPLVLAIGPELVANFTAIKREEWQRFTEAVTDWELTQYLWLCSVSTTGYDGNRTTRGRCRTYPTRQRGSVGGRDCGADAGGGHAAHWRPREACPRRPPTGANARGDGDAG